MDFEEFGIICFLFVVPYAIALQILLAVFVSKYAAARRELNQRGRGQQPLSQTPVQSYTSAPAMQTTPAVQATVPQVQPAVQVPAPAARAAQPAIQSPVPVAPAAPKKTKRISSTSITFGVGVLLLTIVGAAFISVSWSFMGDAARAVTLLAAVAVVYFLSFLSGKVLKLRQTGFAFYTLAGFLGPIVIVGLGMFKLFGKGFSFENGHGWIVAAVAAAVMAVSAAAGKMIYKSGFYTGITYFSATWLVVFLAGQLGEASERYYPHEYIFVALAVLTLLLRIIMLRTGDLRKLSFKIYAEVMSYSTALYMIVSLFASGGDGDLLLFAGAVLSNAELMLHARFTKGREWVRYLLPVAGAALYGFVLIETGYPENIWMIFAVLTVLFAAYFLLKVRTLFSDLLIPSLLTFTVLLFDLEEREQLFAPVAIAAGIACAMAVLASVFKTNKPSGGINAGFASVWYYIMSAEVMLAILGNSDETNYFVFVLPATFAAALVLTYVRTVKDDYRIRIAAEVLLWSSIVMGANGLRIARDFDVEPNSIMLIKLVVNGVLVLLDAILLTYNYYLGAKKKEGLSVPALIVTALAVNAPFFVSLAPVVYVELQNNRIFDMKIAAIPLCIIMMLILVLMRYVPLLKKDKFALYTKFLVHAVSAFLVIWACATTIEWEPWVMLVLMPVIMIALYFCGNRFMIFIPAVILDLAADGFLRSLPVMENKDLYNFTLFGLVIVLALIGRLFFPKKAFSSKGIDYLSFMPVFLMLSQKRTDYAAMLLFIAWGLIAFNYIGRSHIPAKVVAAIASVPIAVAITVQPFIDIPKGYMCEFILAVMLLYAAVMRFAVKPAEDRIMKFIWFGFVAAAVVSEGISAACTGDNVDLLITGVAAVGIFLFSFIKKNKLWFILGIVSLIGIAVYLSATFWSSMAWLLYLLIAGTILIVIAAGNEWRKRHSSEGRKLFKEWTW
ncbi:MAG: hypothetical protein IKH23_02410 [Clostridiales bacterium]|nr:hypothetical protein [Clostridiales bacterium]